MPPSPASLVASRQNHAVSVPFEPGSVFKVITLSAALETTNLQPGEPDRLPRRRAHAAGPRRSTIRTLGYGRHPDGDGAREIEQYRRDPGRACASASRTCTTMSASFGFGQKTGIPLPGESGGKLRKLKGWGTTSLASISMGQEVSVTTVQLAQAGSVVANGGLLVRPRLVLKKGGRDGSARRRRCASSNRKPRSRCGR